MLIIYKNSFDKQSESVGNLTFQNTMCDFSIRTEPRFTNVNLITTSKLYCNNSNFFICTVHSTIFIECYGFGKYYYVHPGLYFLIFSISTCFKIRHSSTSFDLKIQISIFCLFIFFPHIVFFLGL